MVTRGNPQKVKTHTADVIGLSSVDPNDRKEFNAYSDLNGDIVVYAHGKLGDSRYEGLSEINLVHCVKLNECYNNSSWKNRLYILA